VNPFIAVLLGLIQGLTEFLPVSSTAHLTLAGKLIGLIDPQNPEAWTAFIAVMQLGTLAAVLAYFWKDLFRMAAAIIRDMRSLGQGKRLRDSSIDTKLGFAIIVGTLPVAFLGFALKHIIEGAFTKSIEVIVFSLITLALLLWGAEKVARHIRGIETITWVDGLAVGFAQVLALIPGSSRSGTTITAGLFLGLNREAAARFSFLLSIPAVFASGIYEMTKIHPGVFSLGIPNLLLSTVVAGISGYASIAWLLKFLMKNSTMVFVWYRIGLGIILAVLLYSGVILS
jgi:undecaprenyl-diphosphatase